MSVMSDTGGAYILVVLFWFGVYTLLISHERCNIPVKGQTKADLLALDRFKTTYFTTGWIENFILKPSLIGTIVYGNFQLSFIFKV